MSDDMKLLHLYAQDHQHGEAWVVGNRLGLEALRDAINLALQQGSAQTPSRDGCVFATDGEGYEVMVLLDESKWEGAPIGEEKTVWDRLQCPYVGGGPYQRGYYPSALWPWDLWDYKLGRRKEEKRDGGA